MCRFTDTVSCDAAGAGLCSHLVYLVKMCLAFLISRFYTYAHLVSHKPMGAGQGLVFDTRTHTKNL